MIVLRRELPLLPAVTVMLPPLLVKTSSVKHSRTLDPCPYAKEDSLQLRSVLVRLLQPINGGDITPIVVLFLDSLLKIGSLFVFLCVAGMNISVTHVKPTWYILSAPLLFATVCKRHST